MATKSAKPAPNNRPLWNDLQTHDVSVGNIDKSKGEHRIKTDGIKIRGTGVATKGIKARGPMA